MKTHFQQCARRGNFNGNPSQKFRDQQEHWYVDKLLIGDAHSDNAYAGTTGPKWCLTKPTPLKALILY